MSDYICLSLSEETLKVVQIKGAGTTAKITNIALRDVKGLAENDLPKVIQSALAGFNAKSSPIVSVIPPSMTTTKNIEIPSTNPDEIKSIVSLQAGRHTPFSREEIQVGYVNIGVFKTNYTKVLLVIANRNTLKNQLNIFEKAGLKVKKVLFAPEGMAGFYSAVLNLKGDSAPTALIDVGKHSTDFVIILHGMAIASRNIPIGKSHLSQEGEGAFARLVEELGKTVESYQSEDIDQPPSEYVLSMEDEITRKLANSIKEKLHWTVKTSSYIDQLKPAPNVLKQLATEFGDSSFLDVIAPAAMAEETQVNLIPEEVQLQKSIEDQGREVFKTAILGFILLILLGCIFGIKWYFLNGYLTKLNKDYKQNREQVASLEKRSMTTRIIQDYLNSRMVSLDMVNELYNKIPNEVYLTNLLMDEQGNISLQGVADVASIVFNLGTALKESDFFKAVNIKSTTSKKDRGKDVSAFEITLKLKSAADDADETKAKGKGE